MKTYSLAAATQEICGPDTGMKDPGGWVVRQIKRGRFEAYKVGRHYRMTQEQIEAALETLRTKPAEPRLDPPPQRGLSLTATSARRLKSAS